MRSITTLCVVTVVGLSQSAPAQTRGVYRKPNVEPLAQQTVTNLFARIPIDSTQIVAAKEIVATWSRRQLSLSPSDTEYSAKALALLDDRNARVLALLTSRADSARFATNEQTVDSYWRAHLKPAGAQRP